MFYLYVRGSSIFDVLLPLFKTRIYMFVDPLALTLREVFVLLAVSPAAVHGIWGPLGVQDRLALV